MRKAEHKHNMVRDKEQAQCSVYIVNQQNLVCD